MLVHSVGINDYELPVAKKVDGKTIVCPIYATWAGMLQRCYSDSFQSRNPTYIGCTVHPDWLYFSNFRRWMVSQNWKGNQLDKDILSIGKKVYSPKTCCFITADLNRLLVNRGKLRGIYPQGVNVIKKALRLGRNKPYAARCCTLKGRVFLGNFATPEEASSVYKMFKANHIREVADTLPEDIKQGLYRHAEARSPKTPPTP